MDGDIVFPENLHAAPASFVEQPFFEALSGYRRQCLGQGTHDLVEPAPYHRTPGGEVLFVHRKLGRDAVRARTLELLQLVVFNVRRNDSRLIPMNAPVANASG